MSPKREIPPARPTRAAIYARYSTDLQHERSIADQLHVCRDRAQREGWSVHECYTDYALSGADLNRPGLQNMLRDIGAGKIDIILSEALDRLSRDQADIATIFKRMQFGGIDIVTLSEGRVGLVDVGLRGTMNHLYRVENANKVRRGQRGRIKEGKTAGGIAYGYEIVRRVDSRGELVRGERKINEAQAKVVRRIFTEYAEGRSPRAIAKRLNKDGIAGPSGAEWTPSTLFGNPRTRSGILNNETYIGQLLWNRRTYVRNPETGRELVRTNLETEWARGDAPNLRIIAQDLWERVRQRQRTLSCPSSVTALKALRDLGPVRPKYLLSGLVRCGCCGGGFAIRRNDQFSCARFDNRGTCRNELRIGRSALEQKVLGALKGSLSRNLERCVAFCEAYARRLRDFRIEQNDVVLACLRELDHVEAEYDRLTNVKRGSRSGSARDLQRLIARHKFIVRQLRRARSVVEPLEGQFRNHIDGLVDSIAHSFGRHDSYDAFRSAIGQVVLTPNAEKTALEVHMVADAPRRGRGRPPSSKIWETGSSTGRI